MNRFIFLVLLSGCTRWQRRCLRFRWRMTFSPLAVSSPVKGVRLHKPAPPPCAIAHSSSGLSYFIDDLGQITGCDPSHFPFSSSLSGGFQQRAHDLLRPFWPGGLQRRDPVTRFLPQRGEWLGTCLTWSQYLGTHSAGSRPASTVAEASKGDAFISTGCGLCS